MATGLVPATPLVRKFTDAMITNEFWKSKGKQKLCELVVDDSLLTFNKKKVLLSLLADIKPMEVFPVGPNSVYYPKI